MSTIVQPHPGNGYDGLLWFREHRHLMGEIVEAMVYPPFLVDGHRPHETRGVYHLWLRDRDGDLMMLAGLVAGQRSWSADWLLELLLEIGFGPRDLVERYVYELDSFTLRIDGQHSPALPAMPKMTFEVVGDCDLQWTAGKLRVLLKAGAEGVMAHALRLRDGMSPPDGLRILWTVGWEDPIPEPDRPFPGFGTVVEMLRTIAHSPLAPMAVQLSAAEPLEVQHAEHVARQWLTFFQGDADKVKDLACTVSNSDHIIQAIDRLTQNHR